MATSEYINPDSQTTLLMMVREFCRRRGLPVPTVVVSSPDPTVQQILGLLNEGLSDLGDRYEWQHLRGRQTFFHRDGPEYLAIPFNVLGFGFKTLLNETLWDNKHDCKVSGPLTPEEWEALLQFGGARSHYSYTIAGNGVRIYPVPVNATSVDSFSVEFLSSWAAVTHVENPPFTGGGRSLASREWFEKDDDLCMFPSSLLLADLRWRWAEAKGLPYAEQFRQCEAMIVNLQGREPAPKLSLDDDEYNRGPWPGIMVPAGSWPIP